MPEDLPSSEPPQRKRPSVARITVGALGLVGLVCCGWISYQALTGLLAPFAFFLLPIAVMAMIALAAVVGWKTGLLRRFRISHVILATLALVVAAPVVLFGGWAAKGTIDAGKGAPCPTCAVSEYLWNVMDDPIRLRNFLCQDRRDELASQAQQWRSAYQSALDLWQETLELESTVGQDHINGDTATVTTPVIHIHRNHWSKGNEVVSSKQVPWHFDLVNEDGWRVCAVQVPDVCTQLIHCDQAAAIPPASPTPQTSWKVWDTRVSWWCTDDAGPLRKKTCPPPPADWVQPGPWQCAPDYGITRTTQTIQWCRAQGWNITN